MKIWGMVLASLIQKTSRMSKYLIVLGGPTASGKTACSIELAKHFGTEIISADSRQIYKETRIGTAVPDADQLAAVRHHYIQTISLTNYYNASMYELDVLNTLGNLFISHDVVVMTGGSGLYINAVCNGIDDLPAVDSEVRKTLELKYKKEGLESIRNDLKILDPVTYEKVDLKNHLRILKALEISIQTGIPYSSFLTHEKKQRDFKIIRLALNMDRELLYDRINRRVEMMVEEGLVEEVEGLKHMRNTNVLKTVGYREIFSYFDGSISLEESIDLIKRNTRKYARKQITWFRKDNLYPWFLPENTEKMIRYCEQEMKRTK